MPQDPLAESGSVQSQPEPPGPGQ